MRLFIIFFVAVIFFYMIVGSYGTKIFRKASRKFSCLRRLKEKMDKTAHGNWSCSDDFYKEANFEFLSQEYKLVQGEIDYMENHFKDDKKLAKLKATNLDLE